MSLSSETMNPLRAEQGNLESDSRAETDYGFEPITESEARYMANYRPPERLAARIVETGGRSGERAHESHTDELGAFRKSMMPPSVQDHAKACAHLIGKLHALSLKTDAAERRILDAAMARDVVARDKMEALRPQALLDGKAAADYQALALERRRLAMVIAMSRQQLKGV